MCLHAYMFTCLYVHMLTCLYVYMLICLHVYMFTCLYVYMFICLHVNMFKCLYVCIKFLYFSVALIKSDNNHTDLNTTNENENYFVQLTDSILVIIIIIIY